MEEAFSATSGKWRVFGCILHTGPLRLQPGAKDLIRPTEEIKNIQLYLQPYWALCPWPDGPPYPADRVSFHLIMDLYLKRTQHQINWGKQDPTTFHYCVCCIILLLQDFKERAALSTAAGRKKNRRDTRGILYKCHHCSYVDLVMSQICCCEHKSKTVNSDNKRELSVQLSHCQRDRAGLLTV